jgi:hypothetical protein
VYMAITQEKQDMAMTTEEFIRRKQQLFSQVPAPAHPERQQLDIVYGLLRIEIRDKIPRSSIQTFDELLKTARTVEHLLNEKEAKPPANNNPDCKAPTTYKKKCKYCKNAGHVIETCRKRMKAEKATQDFKTDNSAADIPKRRYTSEAKTQAPSPSSPSFSCYGCGTPGVVRTNCPTCHQKKSRPPPSEHAAVSALDATIDARDRPVVFVEVEGKSTLAYIDSCAKTSIASYELYQDLKKKGYHFVRTVVGLTLADGVKKHQAALVSTVPIKFHGRIIPTTLLVLPEFRNVRTLLGVGFIQDSLMVLNLPQATYSFIDDVHHHYELYAESFVSFEQDVKLSPVRVEISTLPSSPTGSATEVAFTRPYKLIPIDTQPPPSKRHCTELFDGYSPVMDALYEDAKNSLMDYDETRFESGDRDLFPAADAFSVDVKELENLLERNADIFTPNGKPANGFEHTIDTGDHKPISVPPYRLSPLKRDILQKEITKMLDEGVIEPCSSPWAAPVVMVPKKDGGTRVCVDYRQLNSITTADSYPLPRIDDLLHNAKPTPYMSTIDLRAGYWQIRVKEADQNKTAFITPFGIYRFTRMPFGLRNAPATFQRMMDRFRLTLSHVKLLIYLDDLIVMSASLEEHLSHT